MTLPSSGAISLNQMHVEAGGSSGSQVSMGDTDIRDMVLAPSFTQNSFSTYYGAKRAFVLSCNAGFGNIINPANSYTGDPETTTRSRGYSDGEFSNRTPATYGTIGNVNSQSNSNCRNSDYLSNSRICNFEASVVSTTATSTHFFTSIIFRISSSNQPGTQTPNNDNAFKRMSINGVVFARSAASYGSFHNSTPNEDVQWTWQHTFSPSQSFPNDSVAVPPFSASGQITKGIVAAV